MAITNIDKNALKIIRPQIDAALVALGEQLGLKIRCGNATYNPDGLTASFKLEFQVAGSDPKVVRGEADWKAYAKSLYGMETDWLGTDITIQGKTLKIVGLDMTTRKEKNVMLQMDGKSYCIDPGTVRMKHGLPRSQFDTALVAAPAKV